MNTTPRTILPVSVTSLEKEVKHEADQLYPAGLTQKFSCAFTLPDRMHWNSTNSNFRFEENEQINNVIRDHEAEEQRVHEELRNSIHQFKVNLHSLPKLPTAIGFTGPLISPRPDNLYDQAYYFDRNAQTIINATPALPVISRQKNQNDVYVQKLETMDEEYVSNLNIAPFSLTPRAISVRKNIAKLATDNRTNTFNAARNWIQSSQLITQTFCTLQV